MMNPMAMMQMKKHFEKFSANHPRVVQFFQVVPGRIQPGSVIEVTIKDPSGQEISTNMRVTEDDMELIRQLQQVAK